MIIELNYTTKKVKITREQNLRKLFSKLRYILEDDFDNWTIEPDVIIEKHVYPNYIPVTCPPVPVFDYTITSNTI